MFRRGTVNLLMIGLVLLLISLLTPQAAQAKVPIGTDPNFPIEVSLTPDQVVLKAGSLAAGQEQWYAVKVTELDGESRQPLALSLFATPGDGNTIEKVQMDLFPGSYAAYWSAGDLTQEAITTFGQGRIVERDGEGDPLLGTLVWRGDVNNNEPVFVCLRNDNDFAVSYWLFTDFIDQAEFGQSAPATPIEVAPGSDPNHALTMADGVNWGELTPGAERWYAMTRGDLDEELLNQTDLAFYFTPSDGNILHRVHFDVFDACQCQLWARGDEDEMVNMGTGSIEKRDDNPETGELFWSGQLIDNDTYYVRVRNSSDTPINYWLFTADIINPSLGEMNLQ
jgi:hypothetical protein